MSPRHRRGPRTPPRLSTSPRRFPFPKTTPTVTLPSDAAAELPCLRMLRRSYPAFAQPPSLPRHRARWSASSKPIAAFHLVPLGYRRDLRAPPRLPILHPASRHDTFLSRKQRRELPCLRVHLPPRFSFFCLFVCLFVCFCPLFSGEPQATTLLVRRQTPASPSFSPRILSSKGLGLRLKER